VVEEDGDTVPADVRAFEIAVGAGPFDLTTAVNLQQH